MSVHVSPHVIVTVCPRAGVHVCYAMLVFLLHICVCGCMCVCVGQGSRHAAVCRPAVPVNGGTADHTTAADGGGSEVAGAGGKAAGKAHPCTTDTCTLRMLSQCI